MQLRCKGSNSFGFGLVFGKRQRTSLSKTLRAFGSTKARASVLESASPSASTRHPKTNLQTITEAMTPTVSAMIPAGSA